MKWRKPLLSLAVAAAVIPLPALADEGTEEAKPTGPRVLNSIVNSIKGPKDPPGWLKRTTLQLQFREDYKPRYMIETVQPVYKTSPDDAVFTQLNAHSRGGDQTFNIGFGYRRVSYDRVVLGVNAFYDYTTYHDHQRLGAGVEALGVDYEARANLYKRATGAKEVEPGVAQKPMDGFDAEAGGNLIPWRYLEDLKLFAGYQFFNSEYGNDRKYYTLRASYPITGSLEVEAKVYKEENRDEKFYIQIAGGLESFPKKSTGEKDDREVLRRKLLQPVEREHDIVIEEKDRRSGGFTVRVKRGS